MEKLGRFIKRQRRSKKITMKDYCKKLGKSRAFMYHVEESVKIPSAELLDAIASILDIDIKLLLLMAYLEKIAIYDKSIKEDYRQ